MSLSIKPSVHDVPTFKNIMNITPKEESGQSMMTPVPSPDVQTILASIPRCRVNENDTGSFSSTLHMPAEWSPHVACLILFPHNRQTFRLDRAQQQVLNLARTIAYVGREDVYLLCQDEELAGWVQEQLSSSSSMMTMTMTGKEESTTTSHHNDHPMIRSVVCPSDDTWVRDTGPTFVWQTTTITTVKNGTNDDPSSNNHSNDDNDRRLVGLDWDFNAYGGPEEGCYWPCDRDREIAKAVCKGLFDCPSYSIPICLEGGSIHTDGDGTILTTKECLLNANRNPHLSQDDIERVLCEALGGTRVIWLPTGLDADNDTNGHIDNFACFVEPGHVVLAWTDNHEEDVENYERCRDAERVLLDSTDAKGRQFQITKLYLPSPPLRYTQEEATSLAYPDIEDDGHNDKAEGGGGGGGSSGGNYIMSRHPNEKMAASYVNFYIANQAVVAPQFGVGATDQMALDTLQRVFPDRKVVGVPTREILLGGGNIHCQTQQVPAS